MDTRFSRTSSIRLVAFGVTNRLPGQKIWSIMKDHYMENSMARESSSSQEVKAKMIKARVKMIEAKVKMIKVKMIKVKMINTWETIGRESTIPRFHRQIPTLRETLL
jgi:hypothetical protein